MEDKKGRVSWKFDGVEKTFLESCLHEVTANGREGGSLKAVSWKIVAEKLQKEHNFIVDQKQMKNHYDSLKAKFGAFLKLRNKTGNVYNPITNTFNLTEEEWALETKSNKHVDVLRRIPLPFPDLCTQLFEGATSTGFDGWGPTSTLPRPSQNSSTYNLKDFDEIESARQEPVVVSEDDMSSNHSKKRKGKYMSKDVSKNKNTGNSRMIAIEDDISKVAKVIVEKHVASDISACMEKLKKLEWEKGDPRYTTAINLFGESADKRQVWLSIDPEICETWVRSAGARYGLL